MVDLETKVYQEDAPVMNGLEPREVPLAGEWEEASCPADAYTLSYRQATKFAVDEIRSACLFPSPLFRPVIQTGTPSSSSVPAGNPGVGTDVLRDSY
jgi:hypothetical protein